MWNRWLRLGRVLFHQLGIGGPHIHANDAKRMGASCAHFFGEERSDLGPVVAHPQQNPSLQVVDHRHINLPFSPAYLIDPDDMHRRPRAMFQSILHRPLHDRCHALPVQTVLAGRSCQLSILGRATSALDRAVVHYTRPQLGPGKSLHAHPAARTSAARTITHSFNGGFRIDKSAINHLEC